MKLLLSGCALLALSCGAQATPVPIWDQQEDSAAPAVVIAADFSFNAAAAEDSAADNDEAALVTTGIAFRSADAEEDFTLEAPPDASVRVPEAPPIEPLSIGTLSVTVLGFWVRVRIEKRRSRQRHFTRLRAMAAM